MIACNLRLVVSQAWHYQGHGLPLEDLVQEGMFGLIRAVERFAWRKSHEFSTYGVLWIRQAIQRGPQHHGPAIRIPTHIAQRQVKLRKVERELPPSWAASRPTSNLPTPPACRRRGRAATRVELRGDQPRSAGRGRRGRRHRASRAAPQAVSPRRSSRRPPATATSAWARRSDGCQRTSRT